MNNYMNHNETQDDTPSSSSNEISVREVMNVPARYRLDHASEEDAHLRDHWRSVRSHIWLVLGVATLVTMLVTIYMARQPDVFGALVRIQADADINNAVGAFKGNPVIVNNTYEDPTYLNTQIQILSSASLLSRVVKTLDLEHNHGFLRPAGQNRSTWQNLSRMVGIGRNVPEPEQPRISSPLTLPAVSGPVTSADNLEEVNKLAPHVESLQRLLDVRPVRDTRLIEIRFSHSNPDVAAKVVNTIAEVFVLLNLEKKTETNFTTGDFLQKRIAELQSEIRTGEEKLINYAKNNQILSLDVSQNTVVDRLVGLNKQLLEAENERKMAEAAFRVNQEPGAAEARAAASTRELDVKLADLKQRRDQLLVDNTEEWPEVKEVKEQIAGVQTRIQVAQQKATWIESKLVESRYHQSLDRERALRRSFDEQRGTTLTQNEAAINYRIIQQEIGTNKGLLDGLLQRSKENDVSAAGTQNNIHVVDYAPTPKMAVGPRRLQVILIAFVLSLAVGVGLALFLEYMDDTVDTPDCVEKELGLPALAVIPMIDGPLRRFIPGRHRNKTHGNGQLARLTGADSHSALAESYRQLRTSVLLSKAGRAPKTLLVTSSLPAEGKTTTAINIATSLAQTEANVLIVDADMRRPRMHSIFHLSSKQGLSTILSTEMAEADILNMIQKDRESGIYVLTCGPIPPNPAELLGSVQMRRLMRCLESTFTHIVIDSPPVASFTDSVLLGCLVDGVLLVVYAGKSSREMVSRVTQSLLDVGAKIIGVVLNKATLRPHDYYYYQSYDDHAYYESGDSKRQVAN